MRESRSGSAVVKYSDNPLSQGQLRTALFHAWSGRCSWCGRSISDPSDAEIDHVIGRSSFDVEREKFADLLPADVERDDVENLALICTGGRRCNQRKSNRVFFGAQSDILQRAVKLAGGVRERVMAMRSATGLDADMQRLLSAPLDEATRRIFQRSGALLAQRLEAVDPGQVDRRTSIRVIELSNVEPSPVGPGCFGIDDDGGDATAELDSTGREADVIARACGLDLRQVIATALTMLIERLDQRVRDVGLESDLSDGGFTLMSQREVEVHGISAQLQSKGRFAFTGNGSIWSLHSASIAWAGDDGETREGQRDVSVDGPFEFTALTSVLDADVPTDVDEIELDDTGVRVERI